MTEITELLESTERMLEDVRRSRERQERREGDRGFVALMLAPTVTVAQALYRGHHVPRELLDERFRDRLVCWEGRLTDDLILDVLVLWEADRAAGDIEPAAAPPWLRSTSRRAA